MRYDEQIGGSPLIPDWILLTYGISVLLIFFFSVYSTKKQRLKIPFRTLIIFHGLILTAITMAVFFWLIPVPRIKKISFQTLKNDKKGAFEITFDKPVRRKELFKSITPEIPGIWIFEDPLYSTHLYRKLVFYPYAYLTPGTNYDIALYGIRNFLNSNISASTYKFVTPDIFDVLGETTSREIRNGISVLGSFPEDGWDGINVDTTIRIRFNQAVDRISAQSHFSILPQVAGTFSWDGNILVFKPASNLKFASRYTFNISSGIKSLSGNISSQDYTATFTTQEETTKLKVPIYLQKYALSCEAAALRMVLAYRGVLTTEDEILPKIGFDPNRKNGSVWGNPYVGFVGKVGGKQMVNGYGVYWEPIARAANNFRYAKSFENWSIEKLTESVLRSTPVIVWISIKGRTPTNWTTPSGDRIKAVPDEHSVVVVGFTGPPNNPIELIVNDPLIGEAHWDRELFEKKWRSFSNSGVLVF